MILHDVKQIRDMAETIRQSATPQEDSVDIQNTAADMKLRAERQAGVVARTDHWQQITTLPEAMFETGSTETKPTQDA